MEQPIIGVLAMQGAYQCHRETLAVLGVSSTEVRTSKDLDQCDALIIPGGESSVIDMQIKHWIGHEALISFSKTRPIFGTCAGLILLSNQVSPGPTQGLGILDINTQRNAYGRQTESFSTETLLCIESKQTKFNAIFIRAPRIQEVGPEVTVLAHYQQDPILVQQGFHLAASFHPELGSDTYIHRYFLNLVLENNSIKT